MSKLTILNKDTFGIMGSFCWANQMIKVKLFRKNYFDIQLPQRKDSTVNNTNKTE